MTAPLRAIEFDPDTRALALNDGATQRLDQRLNVCEHDRCRRWARQDRNKRLTVFGVHD